MFPPLSISDSILVFFLVCLFDGHIAFLILVFRNFIYLTTAAEQMNSWIECGPASPDKCQIKQ